MNSHVHAVAGYVLFVFLGWLVLRDRQRFLDAWRSRKWKPVKARVTDVEDQTFELDGVSRYGGDRVISHTARFFTFRYSVDGGTYQSKRYSYDGDLKSDMPCLEAGNEVTIYHDPCNPALSVVRRGISLQMLFVPLAAVGSLLWAWFHSD